MLLQVVGVKLAKAGKAGAAHGRASSDNSIEYVNTDSVVTQSSLLAKS